MTTTESLSVWMNLDHVIAGFYLTRAKCRRTEEELQAMHAALQDGIENAAARFPHEVPILAGLQRGLIHPTAPTAPPPPLPTTRAVEWARMEEPMNASDRLRNRMTRESLTRDDLAAKFNVPRAHIDALFTDNPVNHDGVAERIAAVLNREVSYLWPRLRCASQTSGEITPAGQSQNRPEQNTDSCEMGRNCDSATTNGFRHGSTVSSPAGSLPWRGFRRKR